MGNKEGKIKGKDANGYKCEYYVNKKGQKDGEYKSWYSNGKLLCIRNYKNDKTDGICKYWYPNSNYWVISSNKNGTLDGKYKGFHRNGFLHIECGYKNGFYDGEYKIWNEEGFLRHWNYLTEEKRIIDHDINVNKKGLQIKYCIRGWKILKKLIITKKERRMKKLIMQIKDKISKIDDCLIYSLIMEYVSWDEKLKLIE
jgi:hypothetical protein